MVLKDLKYIDVEKWEVVLKYFCLVNGFVYDGWSDLKLENMVVDLIF